MRPSMQGLFLVFAKGCLVNWLHLPMVFAGDAAKRLDHLLEYMDALLEDNEFPCACRDTARQRWSCDLNYGDFLGYECSAQRL